MNLLNGVQEENYYQYK